MGRDRATTTLDRMLDDGRSPTSSTWPCRRTVRWRSASGWSSAGIPFLTEKPLAASDAADRPGWRRRSHRAGLIVACRVPPPGARHPDRGARVARRFASAARRGPLARRDAWSGLVGPGGTGWRPGHRAGDPPVRPGPLPGRRGDGRRCGLDARRADLAARLERGRQHRGGPPLRERGDRVVREHAPAGVRDDRDRVRVGGFHHDADQAAASAARATGTPSTTTGRPSARSAPGPTRTRDRRAPSSTRSRPTTRAGSCRATRTRSRPID